MSAFSNNNNAGIFPMPGAKQMRMAAIPLSTSGSNLKSETEYSRTHLHGRQSLSMVVSLDAIALTYVLLTLLLSHFDGYDMFLLALHLPHLFTLLLAYVVVNYSSTVVDVLNMLVLFYLVAMCVDALVLVVRFGLLFHADTQYALFMQGVRLAIAIVFIFVDLCGVLFAQMSRATAYTLALRTDEQIQALSEQVQRFENMRGVSLPQGGSNNNNSSPV